MNAGEIRLGALPEAEAEATDADPAGAREPC